MILRRFRRFLCLPLSSPVQLQPRFCWYDSACHTSSDGCRTNNGSHRHCDSKREAGRKVAQAVGQRRTLRSEVRWLPRTRRSGVSKRWNSDAAFQARVALNAGKREHTVSELCADQGWHRVLDRLLQPPSPTLPMADRRRPWLPSTPSNPISTCGRLLRSAGNPSKDRGAVHR